MGKKFKEVIIEVSIVVMVEFVLVIMVEVAIVVVVEDVIVVVVKTTIDVKVEATMVEVVVLKDVIVESAIISMVEPTTVKFVIFSLVEVIVVFVVEVVLVEVVIVVMVVVLIYWDFKTNFMNGIYSSIYSSHAIILTTCNNHNWKLIEKGMSFMETLLDCSHSLDGQGPIEAICKCVGIDFNSHAWEMCWAIGIS